MKAKACRLFVRLGFAAAALLSVVAACSRQETPGNSATPNPAPAAAPVPAVPPTPAAKPSPAPAAQGGRIAVDVSASMRGFAAAKKSTQFHKLLTAVSSALSRVQATSPLEHCRVSKSVDCTSGSSGFALESAKNYRAEEARLDLVARRPPAPSDPREVTPPDPLDSRRVTVLLTDGMLSTWSKPTASATGSCAAGVDLTCLGDILKARVQEGYGIWLGMVLLPFDGMHFAEKKLSGDDAKRIKGHIESARRLKPWALQPLKVGKLKNVGTGGTSGFAYKGLKPLLVFVLSKDVAAGRLFVTHLQTELASSHVTEPGDDRFHYVELSPTQPPALKLDNIFRVGPSTAELQFGKVQQADDAFLVPITCTSAGQGVFNVDYSSSVPPTNTWPSQVDVRHEVVPLQEVPAGFEGPLAAGNSRFAWRITCLKLRAGETRVSYGFRTLLRPRTQVGDVWWATFSARNTFDEPEKVYSLRELVSAVLETRTKRDVPGPRIFYAVRRE